MPTEKLDEETGLPKATVDKLIQELTPNGYSVSKETRSLLRDAAHVFLHTISIEANRLCDIDKKKTISIQHIYKSLEKYKFGSFIEECDIAAKNYDEYSKHKPSRQNKLNKSGKTLEELQALQMSLFQEAAKQQLQDYEIQDDDSEESKNE
jgi:down-regulator of transcription 1